MNLSSCRHVKGREFLESKKFTFLINLNSNLWSWNTAYVRNKNNKMNSLSMWMIFICLKKTLDRKSTKFDLNLFLKLVDLKKYLQNLNERRVALPMPFLLSLCSELIYGLRQIHEKNIIHLDIKPANILFSISKLWKFSDFGLSRKFKRTVVT